MMSRGLNALAVALALGVAAPAHAGCCVVGEVPLEPAEVGQMYVVNQGPILAGPGHYLRRESPDALPYAGGYPYVGPIFTGYPYGVQDSGGYPRGTYSPFTGYPYVDPPRGLNAPSYVKYRMSYRPVRVYRRPAAPRVIQAPPPPRVD